MVMTNGVSMIESREEDYREKRKEIRKRQKGVRRQQEELIAHLEDVNRGISMLDKELLKIEGEFRILEELINEDYRLQRENKK